MGVCSSGTIEGSREEPSGPSTQCSFKFVSGEVHRDRGLATEAWLVLSCHLQGSRLNPKVQVDLET